MTLFDFFQLAASNIWTYGITFLIVLTILVFVHEWGHYIVARLCGVRVEKFSIGFGPELFGITDRHGTRWSFSAVPLGGYVKMFGDTDPASAGHTDEVTDEESGEKREFTEEEKKTTFFNKSVGKRAAIVFAGPAINFLFAIILFAFLFSTTGKIVTLPVATAVIEGSAADKAGFQPHDEILQIDGKPVQSFDDIRREVMIGLDRQMQFKVKRDGGILTLDAQPEKVTSEDRFGFSHSRGMLGIIGPSDGLDITRAQSVDGIEVNSAEQALSLVKERLGTTFRISMQNSSNGTTFIIAPPRNKNTALSLEDNEKILAIARKVDQTIQLGPFASLSQAVDETWQVTASTMRALGQMIVGTRSATELGGIIRIGAIAGDMAQSGLIALIMFTAILSINLGLINLFPIPMLDGGHLLFYAVEAIKGSPIPDQIQEYAFRIGLFILVGIMLFANLNDLVQLIS